MSDLVTSLESGTGLANPTLSYGLTAVSDWSTQMAFLDLMKMSRPWIGHSTSAWNAMSVEEMEAGGHLDANGWPMSIPEGLTSVGTIWAWEDTDAAATASRAGVYVLEYEGTGTLQIQGVTILSSEPGRIVVQNLTGGVMQLNITSTDPGGTGDYIRNITMVAQEHEALFEAGQMFNPDWLAIVQDARELRFKDWMAVDGETSADWGDRPEVGDVTWAGTAGGVPVEVMVALANQTGTEPWFTMPAGASEEYIRNFATYVRDPVVTVIVTGFVGPFSEQIRVVGEAARPQFLPDPEYPRELHVDRWRRRGGGRRPIKRATVPREWRHVEDQARRLRIDSGERREGSRHRSRLSSGLHLCLASGQHNSRRRDACERYGANYSRTTQNQAHAGPPLARQA